MSHLCFGVFYLGFGFQNAQNHAYVLRLDPNKPVASDLGHALAAEERRVVVVASELADDEQGAVQTALCNLHITQFHQPFS